MSQTLHENDIILPNLLLHYARWGNFTRQDRVVILVHGLTANHKTFLELGPYLAERGWYVIAPDLRGRGLSAKPAHGYGLPFHYHDLLDLCDALGLEAPMLVGHSLGAIIGMFMAAFAPQRLRKLVMIDAGGKIPEDSAATIAGSVNRLGTVFPSLNDYLGAMRQLPVFTWNPLWEAYFRYDADVRSDGTVTSRVPKAAIFEESGVMAMIRTEELPRFVTCPTLIARATLGTLAPDRGFILPAAEAERLRTVIPDCQVIEIPETNHYTIVIAPILCAGVASFLENP